MFTELHFRFRSLLGPLCLVPFFRLCPPFIHSGPTHTYPPTHTHRYTQTHTHTQKGGTYWEDVPKMHPRVSDRRLESEPTMTNRDRKFQGANLDVGSTLGPAAGSSSAANILISGKKTYYMLSKAVAYLDLPFTTPIHRIHNPTASELAQRS